MTKDREQTRDRHYSRGRTCGECSRPIVNAAKSGMCKLCTLARRNADPNTRLLISEGAKQLYRDNPYALARRQAVINRNRTKALADPAIFAKYQALGRATVHNLFTPEAIERRLKNLRAATHKIREAKLGWCPLEYRELHRRNVKSRKMKAADSRRQIEAMIRAKPKPVLSFEEKLKAVQEGRATICDVTRVSNDLDFTVGGVSSGWAA